MSKKIITPNQKLKAVRKYLMGNTSYKKIAVQYQVDASSVRGWVSKYKALGENAFKVNCCNLNYSAEFKEKVVKSYISGEGSFRDIAVKYKIHAPSTVSKWILQYNSHEKLLDSRPGGIVSMATGNGRKTTYEERIEIIKYCIEHQMNYAETALHFQVSYQQIYSWYQKYTKGGVEVLHDRRGRNKPLAEMTELEKLKAENKLLQAKNQRIQMENDFLKKLEEIERRRY